MKKMVIIIVILAIIFVGMVIRRNNLQSASNGENVTIEEINDIEKYISKVYMWKEITGEALPKFEDINQAEETWIWQVVKKNLEEDSFSYERIEEKSKELFGDNFQKKFPKEGIEGIMILTSDNLYNAMSTIIDEKEDKFLLYDIQKNKNDYIVELIEYIEDHVEGSTLEDDQQEYNIIMRNTNDEEIEKIRSTVSEVQIKEAVKNNIDRYTKKKVTLHREENGELIIIKVE